jgi:ligand-binding sensor domain-containing protein
MEAVSANQVWVTDESDWFLLRDGNWLRTGPESDDAGSCPEVAAATDGALWVGTPQGLTRVTSQGISVIAAARSGPQGFSCPTLLPGADGSVWVGKAGDPAGSLLDQGSGTTLYRADGTRESIGRPPGYERTCLQAAGPDGSVWVSQWIPTDSEEQSVCPLVKPARWDGHTWERVHVPAWVDYEWLSMAVTDDGATWMALSEGVARYADGQWSRIGAGYLGVIRAITGGRVCGSRGNPKSIVCYDAAGRRAEISTDQPRTQGDDDDLGFKVGIAPDGAIWVSSGAGVHLLTDGPPSEWK